MWITPNTPEAHSHSGWLDEPVPDSTLKELYDLVKWARLREWRPLRILFFGHGNPAKVHPRGPRLSFDEVGKVV